VRFGIVLCFGSGFRLSNSLTKFLKFPFLHFLVFWFSFGVFFFFFVFRASLQGVVDGLWLVGG